MTFEQNENQIAEFIQTRDEEVALCLNALRDDLERRGCYPWSPTTWSMIQGLFNSCYKVGHMDGADAAHAEYGL